MNFSNEFSTCPPGLVKSIDNEISNLNFFKIL